MAQTKAKHGLRPADRAKALPGRPTDRVYQFLHALLKGKQFEVDAPCACAACAPDRQHDPFCAVHDPARSGEGCDCGLSNGPAN